MVPIAVVFRIVPDVNTPEECQGQCLSAMKFLCGAWTWKSNTCYLYKSISSDDSVCFDQENRRKGNPEAISGYVCLKDKPVIEQRRLPTGLSCWSTHGDRPKICKFKHCKQHQCDGMSFPTSNTSVSFVFYPVVIFQAFLLGCYFCFPNWKQRL